MLRKAKSLVESKEGYSFVLGHQIHVYQVHHLHICFLRNIFEGQLFNEFSSVFLHILPIMDRVGFEEKLPFLHFLKLPMKL